MSKAIHHRLSPAADETRLVKLPSAADETRLASSTRGRTVRAT